MAIGVALTGDDGGYQATIMRVERTPIGWAQYARSIGCGGGCRLARRDPSLTPVSGMVAVTELVSRLGMIKLLDAAIGAIKTRDRGLSGGQLLVGLAAAQLAGEDFLVGLDRQRADAEIPAVPGPGTASETRVQTVVISHGSSRRLPAARRSTQA